MMGSIIVSAFSGYVIKIQLEKLYVVNCVKMAQDKAQG
jgi:hypothetical protein